MAKAGELWRITGPTFQGLVQFTNRGHVWWAAPAIKQMERYPREKVISYCVARGWKIERETRGDNWPFSATWEEVRPTDQTSP